jgi:hypothetical protein
VDWFWPTASQRWPSPKAEMAGPAHDPSARCACARARSPRWWPTWWQGRRWLFSGPHGVRSAAHEPAAWGKITGQHDGAEELSERLGDDEVARAAQRGGIPSLTMVAAASGELRRALRLEEGEGGADQLKKNRTEGRAHWGGQCARGASAKFQRGTTTRLDKQRCRGMRKASRCLSGRKKLRAEESRGGHRWRLYAEGERGWRGVLYAVWEKRGSGTNVVHKEGGWAWRRVVATHTRQWLGRGARGQRGAGDRVPWQVGRGVKYLFIDWLIFKSDLNLIWLKNNILELQKFEIKYRTTHHTGTSTDSKWILLKIRKLLGFEFQ